MKPVWSGSAIFLVSIHFRILLVNEIWLRQVEPRLVHGVVRRYLVGSQGAGVEANIIYCDMVVSVVPVATYRDELTVNSLFLRTQSYLTF